MMNKKSYTLLLLVLFVFSGCAASKSAKNHVEPDAGLSAAKTLSLEVAPEDAEPAPQKTETEPEKVKEEEPLPEQIQIPDKPFDKKESAVWTKQEDLKKPERSDGTGRISLNFDNADIYEVINALSDILGINYIIDPAVKGKVNINTSGEIDKSQLLPILETIFEINNIALVPYGDIYKIVPVKEAYTQMMDFTIGTEAPEFDSYDQVLIQIVPLQHVAAAEVANLLKRFIRRGGDVIHYERGNFVVIIDSAANVRKLLGLVSIIDTDIFQNTDIRFFKISFANVKDVAKELDDIFSSLGIPKTTDKGIGLRFIPIERVSCVLAISSIPGIFEKVEHWVKVLDTIDLEASEQVFIYFVENGKAEELADVIQKIYGEGSTESQPRARRPAQGEQQAASPAVVLEGKLKIVTDSATNSIIIRATPHDYSIIKDTIQRLDIMPRQVLIEVLIAEVSLTGDTQFGVEWALRGDYARIGGYKGMEKTESSYGLGGLGADLAKNLGRGLTYRFDSSQLQVFLMAQASQNKLNILSSPHILAAENKEARIEVGQEVPIVTSEYTPMDVRDDRTSTSRSIQYRSTGVILRVTPRISDKGLVAMDIMQEVSEAQEIKRDGIQSPVISQRRAETSLVVADGQTIVIGGLIKNQSSQSRTGVPFLSKLPLLGYLFSSTRDTQDKTELLISITPHVVNTLDAAESVSLEFQEKLDSIRRLIKRQ